MQKIIRMLYETIEEIKEVECDGLTIEKYEELKMSLYLCIEELHDHIKEE